MELRASLFECITVTRKVAGLRAATRCEGVSRPCPSTHTLVTSIRPSAASASRQSSTEKEQTNNYLVTYGRNGVATYGETGVLGILLKKSIEFLTYGRNGVATYGEKGCWGFYSKKESNF